MQNESNENEPDVQSSTTTAPTSENLAQELIKAGAPDWLVEDARKNHFHDFLGPTAMPQHDLIRALSYAAQTAQMDGPTAKAFADRVANGELDASKDESDDWAKSPEGQEAWNALISERPNREQRRRMKRDRQREARRNN